MNKTKTKLISIALLGILLLLSSANTSLAVTSPSWLGVNEDEVHTWAFTAYKEGVKAIVEDMPSNEVPFDGNGINWDGPLIPASLSINLIANITGVSANGSIDVFNCTGVSHVNLTVYASYNFGGIAALTGHVADPVNVPILDPSTENFSYLMGALLFVSMNKMFGGNESGSDGKENTMATALVIPKGMDWDEIVSQAQVYLDKVNDTMIASKTGNGMTVSVPEYTIDANQAENISITLVYDTDGKLTNATLTYGGLLAFSISYGASGIPGFELTIVIGVSAAATIGLIYTVKRKRKILN